MVWSDQRLRWEWSGMFGPQASLQFKFSQATNADDWSGGNSWGWSGANGVPGVAALHGTGNIRATTLSAGKYLVHFDDVSRSYGVEQHPIWLDWLKSNNLDASTPRNPWPLDSDGDGIQNFQEYALGGNPHLHDQTALPISVVTNIPGGNHLVLRWFERTNKDSSLNINPQLSTNLGSANWLSLSNSVVTHADTNGIPPGHRRKEVSVPLEGNGSFLRLKINGP